MAQKGSVILVVDDEPELGRYVAATLSRFGYNAIVAESGRQALYLSRLPGRSFDLVVTDISMSDLCGPDLVDALREDDPKLRVIYMTGYGRENLDRYGCQLADTEVLGKPFTPTELLNAVVRAIGPAHS